MFEPGQIVEWPVRAQGVKRTASGAVIAFAPDGGRPIDFWPKRKTKPTARELPNFTKVRGRAFVIVEEKVEDRVYYRTPPLSTPVTLAKVKAKKKPSA